MPIMLIMRDDVHGPCSSTAVHVMPLKMTLDVLRQAERVHRTYLLLNIVSEDSYVGSVGAHHESLMEIRSEQIVDELFWLFVLGTSCLVLENDIVVPSKARLV
jgi:hypothetical protein